jgi:TRAP-type C4-dicarboxylate transport system permease small subunit
MPGIDFDRQAFVPATPPQTRSTIQMAGPVLLVAALLAIALIGYKIFAANSQAQVSTAAASTSQGSANMAAPAEIAGAVAENREAWEATTNRLADVVGVVGIQQGEIAASTMP